MKKRSMKCIAVLMAVILTVGGYSRNAVWAELQTDLAAENEEDKKENEHSEFFEEEIEETEADNEESEIDEVNSEGLSSEADESSAIDCNESEDIIQGAPVIIEEQESDNSDKENIIFPEDILIIDADFQAKDSSGQEFDLSTFSKIESQGDLEIILEDCAVTVNSIDINGSFVLSGTGYLNVVSTDRNLDGAVKVNGNIEIISGILNVTANESNGIYAEGNVRVIGGESNVQVQSNRMGILSFGDIIVSEGAAVYTNTLDKPGTYAAEGSIIADGGRIISETSDIENSFGILYAKNRIEAVNQGEIFEQYIIAEFEIDENNEIYLPLTQTNITDTINYNWNDGSLVPTENETLLPAERITAGVTEITGKRTDDIPEERIFIEEGSLHTVSFKTNNELMFMPISAVLKVADSALELKELLESPQLVNSGGLLSISLSDDFVSSFSSGVTAVIPAEVDYNIIIDAENRTLSAASGKVFNITNNSSGTMKIQNLEVNSGKGITFAGTGNFVIENVRMSGITEYALTLTGTSGTVEITDSIFNNGAGAIYKGGNVKIINTEIIGMTKHAVNEAVNLYVENSLFKDNRAEFGAAIKIYSNSKTEIQSSSFINNTGYSPGWHGGAISAEKSANIEVVIHKSYFDGNIAANTGNIAGGLGGALCIYLCYDSYVEVDQCVFNENKSTLKGTTSDGGAIAIKNNASGAQTNFLITNSTFYGNETQDDGGAILIEGNGSSVVAGTIANCTFFGNNGRGDETGSNGGAVQVYDGEGYLTIGTTVDFYNNTFYGNKIGGNAVKPTYGGALSFTGTYKGANGSLKNNLFIENINDDDNQSNATALKTKNIYSGAILGSGTIKDQGGNVGYDKGSVITYATAFEAFGTEEPVLSENGVFVNVGCDLNSAHYLTTLKSLLIAPEFAGDNTGVSGVEYTEDMRGRVRNVPDSGAVNINWVKFDANGGQWPDVTATAYNTSGDEFDLFDPIKSKCEIKYAVDTTDINTVTVPENPEFDSYVFVGWALQKFELNEGTLADCIDADSLEYKNQTVYALWKDKTSEKAVITYDANGGTGTVTDNGNPYTPGTVITILSGDSLSKNGYEFVCWNTKADGNGVAYYAGDAYNLAENTVLYAQWKKLSIQEEVNIYYDANGGTGSVVDNNNPYKLNDTVTVLSGRALNRNGYTFISWNTEAGGSGITYNTGNKFTITNNTTLYAQWSRDRDENSRDDREEGGSQGSKDKIVEAESVVPVFNPDINNFLDTENHYAYIVGYPDGTVRPEDNITRAETASIFFRLLTRDYRKNIWSKVSNFSDVNRGDWYMNAVSTLTNGNILSGYPDGTFRPSSAITRAEFASMAVRFSMDSPVITANPFNDITDHWAKSDIIKACGLGYVSGDGSGKFNPDTPITRAEVMTLLNNVLNRHVESESDMLPEMVKWSDNTDDKWYYYQVQEATNSHYYTRKPDEKNEIWTSIRSVPKWEILNEADAQPEDLVVN